MREKKTKLQKQVCRILHNIEKNVQKGLFENQSDQNKSYMRDLKLITTSINIYQQAKNLGLNLYMVIRFLSVC